MLENIIEGPVIVKGEPKEDATVRARELLAKVGPGREGDELSASLIWRAAAACRYCTRAGDAP